MSTNFRESFERASLPVVQRLGSLPRLAPFAAVLLLLVGGILIDGWGWVLTAVVAVFLLWILALAWPRLTRVERLMRVAVLAIAVVIALTQALPR